MGLEKPWTLFSKLRFLLKCLSIFCAVINTADDSALAASDYTAKTNEALTVAAGATGNIVLSITSDDIFEDPAAETFDVTISGPGVGSTLTMSTVTINDDDGKKGIPSFCVLITWYSTNTRVPNELRSR